MPEPSPTWNSGICCSRLARSLFSTSAGAGGSIFTGARLARSSLSNLRTSSRSSRIARACCQSLACCVLRRNSGPSASTPCPIRSITAEPRQARRQRDRHQQQREQEQVPADGPEPVIERSTDQLPEDAAAARGEIGGAADAQVQQAGRGHQETDDADQPQGRPQVGFAVAIGVHAEQRDPRDAAEHDRQQEGDVARQVQQHVGQPRADAAADVVQRRGNAARVRPARIGRRERHQAREQVEEERRDQDQRDVAPQSLATRVRRRCRLLRGTGALAADGFLERAGHRAVRP